MKNRILTSLLIIAMLLVMLPVTVAAAEGDVAKVGDTGYTDIQEAIKAAAPSGTVEILSDVTVDKWIMFAEKMTISNGNLITLNINGLIINGNGHTLTIKSIESASNGNRLFYDAQNLNINDLTIKYDDAAANQGGIGLQSGTISKVTFIDGGYGVLPGAGDVTITGCTFNTKGSSIYFEEARDNLTVTGCAFNNNADANVILLRGNVKFTNNIIISGRTVNVVSGSPVVTGNNFGDVRFKVYNDATATISGNTIKKLAFENNNQVKSKFTNNILSDDAQKTLASVDSDNVAVGLEGSGTANEPYLIKDLDDLVWFRNDVNVGNTYEGKYVKLTSNIDLAGYTEMNVNYQGNNVSAPTFRPIGDTDSGASFKGTFDGGEHTISNLYISGWDIDYHWDNYGSAGLFGTVDNATIKNLTVSGFEIQVEGGDVAAIAGHAVGTCTFENITVTDSKIATYNNGCAGIAAWSEDGAYTFKNIEITDSVVLAGLWGSFDSSIGGVVAQADEDATYLFENVTVACRLDCYNDVTASYKYYNYRMCGMLIGRSTRYLSDDESEVNADNITCENVNITIGEWANYTYIWDDSLSRGCQRVEPGYTYGGVDVEDYPEAEIIRQPMTSIIGGGQYGYNGSTIEELVEQGFDEKELEVEDLALAVRSRIAKVGETYYPSLQDAINAANGATITLVADTNEGISIADGATVEIDLGGKTLYGYIDEPCKPTSLSISNGTIKNTNSGKSAIEINAGTLALTNVNVSSARHGVRIDGAVTATIDGGTYKISNKNGGGTYHAVNVSGAANVTIKDGTFIGPKGTAADSGSAVCVQSGSTVKIENGNFSGGKNSTLAVKEGGTLSITGGIFDQDPTDYCAEGYEAKENDEVYVVVPEGSKLVTVTFNAEPATAEVSIEGGTVIKNASGTYTLVSGMRYTYTVSADGYNTEKRSFIAEEDLEINVKLTEKKPYSVEVSDETVIRLEDLKDTSAFDAALEVQSMLLLQSGSFADVAKSDWFYSDVTALVNKGVVSGYPDGSFRPQGVVTWGEALKLVMKAVGYGDIEATNGHWASGYMDTALANLLISGEVDLDAAITREEVANLAAQALKLAPVGIEYPFDDAAPEAAVALYAAGIINGSADNGQLLFRAESTITRAEMAAIIWRVYCAR